MRRFAPHAVALIFGLVLSSLGLGTRLVTAAPPTGFQNNTVIGGLTQPTVIAFTPDGRMLIAERAGIIKLVLAGATSVSATPFLQLTNINTDQGERGLVGLVLDPSFATTGYYYVFYTANSPLRDRISRFTASGNTTVSGSELIMWQDIDMASWWHHGGNLTFGPDGKLYASTGFNDDATAGSANGSQRLDSYHGKILRLNSDGTIPSDNPFYDGGGSNLDAIWARGLRNPFRFSFDAQTGVMYIGDVGGNLSNSIEEVNRGIAGANYGWPICEGSCATVGMTNPILTYDHNNRDASIVGGFVYRATQFPVAYRGNYFYADYAQNWIKRITFDGSGTITGNYFFEPTNGTLDGPYGDIVDLKPGPDGSLYYVDIALDNSGNQTGFGSVRKISYFAGNQPPTINTASASPTSGPAPLAVTFTGTASDPENDSLSYTWDFGDTATGSGATTSHTYSQRGTYSARLTVSDGQNQTLSSSISITVGSPPIPVILSPTANGSFRAGDVINLSGSASDDGPLTDASYSWTVVFHHATHVHPAAGPMSGPSITFTIPTTGHDFSGSTSYEIILTVTDADGLQASTSVTIYPQKIMLSFDTVPSGLQISFDQSTFTTPFAYDTLIGFQHTIVAPDSQTLSGTTYGFATWSDGGAAQHLITAPAGNQSYTATYQAISSATPTNTAVPPTNTPTRTPTNTPTSTPSPTPGGSFPTTSVLDSFTRANGTIGTAWGGNRTGYTIATNQLDVGAGGDIYWAGTRFAADQEAYLTISTSDAAAAEIDLLLKAQSSTSWSSGVVEVWYDPVHSRVQVWSYSSAQGWVQRGSDIAVSFANGDRFGARMSASGQVTVYRNSQVLATRDASAWTYATSTGYIGIWTDGASAAFLDDFGGGTVVP